MPKSEKLKRAEKELAKLEKTQKGKFEIDTKHEVVKPKGWKVAKDMDAIRSAGKDCIARKIANAGIKRGKK